jgi:caa(3)-type oxidase subunit IV
MASHRKQYLVVFGVLFALTVLEVGVTYTHIARAAMILALVGLALTKAMFVALYYMHLASERRVLRLVVGVPLLVFPPLYAIVLMAEAAWRLGGLGQ